MEKSQFLSFKELETYNELEVKLEYQDLEEIIDLLDIEEYKIDCLKIIEPSMIDELINQKQEQESLIAKLQAELKSIDEIDINSSISHLQSDFNENLKRLFDNLDGFLKEFNSNNNVLPISIVQEYTSTDEQLSRLIIQYSKQVEAVIQAIDFSVHHHCLMSVRAEEYTELCADRAKLQTLSLINLEQEIKATAAKTRYEAALQALEDIVLREQKDKFLNDDIILSKTNSLRQELDQLSLENDSLLNIHLSSEMKELAKLHAEESLLESHNELSDKRSEYESIKLKEILDVMEEQKKKHLLAMAGVLLEQEKVQSEYDCLFEIKMFLDDIKGQVEFRIEQYKKYRLKHELDLAERRAIDSRDGILNEVYKIMDKNHTENNLTFDMLIDKINACLEMYDKNKANYHKTIDKLLILGQEFLHNSETSLDILDIVRNSTSVIDSGVSYADLIHHLADQEQKLNKIQVEIENTRKNFKQSPTGLTEREIFVDFLMTKDSETPKYYLDCEDIM